MAMKIQAGMSINGRNYKKGTDIASYKIYPFFLLYMFLVRQAVLDITGARGNEKR